MGVVKITCKADTFLPFQQIQDFQGELKSRTQDDVDHLISSIERHGFSFPFFVWRQPSGVCSCLDGHGRILALKQMESEGWEIPELPVVYIDAKDEAEARTKLIQINVVSGRFTDSGFRDLVRDIPDLKLDQFNYPDLDLEKLDAELKILAKAQESIQALTDEEWDNALDDSVFAEAGFGTSGTLTADELDKLVPDADVSVPAPMTGTPDVVGEASTVYGQDGAEPVEEASGPQEMVVYCPECGKSFIYKYE